MTTNVIITTCSGNDSALATLRRQVYARVYEHFCWRAA